jgi:hypothetical protein
MKNITRLILLVFFIYSFMIYNINFSGTDDPIYFAYTASIVDDGDLNAVNQVYSRVDKFAISKTYNLPDFHNHGGIVLWLPFYAYGKFIYPLATKLNLKGANLGELNRIITKCVMSFSTIVFGLIAILLTYFLCRVFFSAKIALWSILAMFLGTPFFYYMLFSTGNANIVASLFSVLSIVICSYIIPMKRSHWFLYGMFFSICTVVKLDLWFQIFFISFLFITLVVLKQSTWRNVLYFIIGFSPGFILKIINDYIKYGTFHIGELGLYNPRSYYLFEQLFSTYRGYLYTSPILYICLLGFIFVAINLFKSNKKYINSQEKMQHIFIFILSSYLIIKIFIIAHRYAWGGGTCGGRQLLTEFPIFVLLYAYVLKKQKGFLAYFFFFTITAFFVLWNLLVISEYITKIDLKYISAALPFNIRVKALKNILDSLFYIKDLHLKLIFCSPLLLAIVGIIFYITGRFIEPIRPSFWYIRSKNSKSIKLFSLFTMYVFTTYTIVTLLNIYNNKKNAERLKAGNFFENAYIIAPSEFEKQENVGSMNEMIMYFSTKGDMDKVNEIKRYKKEIYSGTDR